MRKERVRLICAEYLASIGYREGTYSWPKAGRLRVLVDAQALPNGNPKPVAARNGFKSDSPLAACFADLRITTGMSKKAIFEALGAVPRRGDPVRLVYSAPVKSLEMQIEHEALQ